MGFPPQLVQLLKNLYRQQRANVRTDGHTSVWFKMKQGARQGYNLSLCLFNNFAEQVLWKALQGSSGGFRISGKTISNLRYADDIVLLATSPEKLQELVNHVESAAINYNMKMNAAKMKTKTNTEEIEVGTKILEQVNSFMYLGCGVTKDADCANEVKSRLAIGMATMVKLAKVWKDKSISNSTNAWLRSLDIEEIGGNSHSSIWDKCIRRMIRISWTKMMTNKRVYELTEAKSLLLQHDCERKLRYFDPLWDNYGTILRVAWWQVLLRESKVMEGREYPGLTIFWRGLA